MEILSPTTATVAYIHHEDGTYVEEGKDIFDLEVMKMFQYIAAPKSGILTILVNIGQTVEEGEVLARID